MLKVMSPLDWDFDIEPMSMVKVSSRGLLSNDLHSLVKRAGHEFAHQIKAADLKPGDIPVHLIALGATEGYGCNRNGDGFTMDTCRKKHNTFVKHARWYRRHKNKEPDNSWGYVKLAHVNEDMKRIELLAVLNGTKEAAERNGGHVADEELALIAKGDPIPVSMACVTDPEYPVLTRDRGYVRIADVTVGDFVWTHKGRWRKVTEVNRRRYTGEVREFRVNGLPEAVELTADHPMWAKTFDCAATPSMEKVNAARYFARPDDFDKAPAGWTHAQHVEIGDRFFYQPVTAYPGYGAIDDENLATLMGYYLAEGSIGYNGENPARVCLACNMTDSLPRRVPGIVEDMFPEVTVTIAPHRLSKAGLIVTIHNSQCAGFMAQYMRTGCREKQIPPEIFNATREVKLAFIGAWLDGDGWLDKKGAHWSSASYKLLLQGRDLLCSLGIPTSLYKINHQNCATSGYTSSGPEYTLNVSHKDAWALAATSAKAAAYVPPQTQRTKPASMRYCQDGRYAYRISTVTSRQVEDIETYNFEVEEDASYSLGGFISHNCKLAWDCCVHCGNKATKRADYCTEETCPAGGCRHNLMKVGADGRIPYVDNPAAADLCWFDISQVRRPADRTAYGWAADYLHKAASGEVIGGAEIAELVGAELPLAVVLAGSGLNARQSREAAEIYKLAEVELTVDSIDINRIAGMRLAEAARRLVAVDLSELTKSAEATPHALHALSAEGIVLPLKAFLDWQLKDEGKVASVLSSVAAALPGVYSRLAADPQLASHLKRNDFVVSDFGSTAQRVWAAKQATDLSLAEDPTSTRAYRAAIGGKTALMLNGFQKQASHDATALALANRYGLYTAAALAAMPDDSELTLTRKLVVLQNHLR